MEKKGIGSILGEKRVYEPSDGVKMRAYIPKCRDPARRREIVRH